MNLEIDAEARLKALEFGALTLDDVVEWADAKIAAEPNFDARLIEVSLAHSVGDAITALNAFGRSIERPQVAVVVFRFFHEALVAGRCDHLTVARALFRLATDNFIPAPGLEAPMWAFWDDLDLATNGIYGDPEEIKKKMMSFLEDALE